MKKSSGTIRYSFFIFFVFDCYILIFVKLIVICVAKFCCNDKYL